MKVAVTIWDNRISPVFDAAHKLLVAEIEGVEVRNQWMESFNPERLSQLVERLTSQDITVLICGAISQVPAQSIEQGGIRLIPFISGNANRVLQSYAGGRSITSEFLMPGCGKVRPKP